MWRIFIFSWGSPPDRFHENLHFAFLCSVWGPFPGKRPKCILRLEICSLVFCLKGILAKQFHNICRISFTRSFICCRVLWHPEIYIVYFAFGVFVFHLLAFMIIVVITSVTFIVPFEYLMGTWLWPERAAWHPRILPGWQLACSHTNTGHGRDKVAWQIQKYNTNTKIHKDKTVVCTLTPT